MIKLLHPSINPRQPLPLGILVPTSGEPALLIVMPTTGKVTYWESVWHAASSESSRQKQKCTLGAVSGMMSGEVITKVIEAEPHGFVLTLSSGRVAHMNISDEQGKPSITIRYLQSDGSQSVGLFGSLKNVFSTAGWKRDIAAVRAGFSPQRGHRQLVVATSRGAFQVWDLDYTGSQSLLCEVDGKADLLASLVEGGDVFRDRHDHQFEVLDFTFSPIDLGSKRPIIQTKRADCQLWVLTALHGRDSSRYNLLGLTLAGGSITVNVVHPISCYKSPLPSGCQFKPQVLVPENGFAAFVAFEKSVVLISLTEVEESPSSQLQLEAHTVPDPFQDTIEFNKTKSYRNIACAAETPGDAQMSSCVLMVHGFGVIRFLALPMQKGQTAEDRITVTAVTKIEQAVFFGNMPQDLLDFSGRPEISFSQEDIEEAAEDVSDSILRSESKYIPREMPSMEAQLQRRATAMADLIRHLRQRYGTLSRSTRWRLLWDAERMAAAIAMWRTYQASLNAAKKDPNHKNFLAEVVETTSEQFKSENQLEKYETDGVRHWFMNDIWRIERLLPYTDLTIQELLEENVEFGNETDMATHARYITDAGDLQLAVLETAFRFRELNTRLYDLAEDPMMDGVLLSGYEGLDEPWTSTGHVAARVKQLAERAIKFVEDTEDDDESDGEIYRKLKKNLPRQIQIFNQTQIERFRWLKAQPDPRQVAAGQTLQEEYFFSRRGLFLELAGLYLGDEAIRLAEKYEDMDALVELMEIKRLNAEEKFYGETEATRRPKVKECTDQIVSNFAKYGNQWADRYFAKHIANFSTSRILEESPLYQKAFTSFLRRNARYSKLRWINEITEERDYAAAAESLRQAQERESKVWFKKIEFSLGKLAMLAATQQEQIKDDVAKTAIQETDRSVAILAIQEELYDYMRPMLGSAIDADAEADLVMESYKSISEHQHCIRDFMKRYVARLVAREILQPEDLIEALIFMDPEGYEDYDDYIDRRFFLALQILRHLDLQKSDPARHQMLEGTIWRRCYIQDDWESINRTEDKDEQQAIAETEGTALFITAKELYGNGMSLHPAPSLHRHQTNNLKNTDLPLTIPAPTPLLDIGTSLASLRTSSRYASYADNDLTRLAKDLQHESRILSALIEKGRLEERYPGVVEAAKESVKADRERELDMMRKQRVSEAENVRVLKQRAGAGREADGEEDGGVDGRASD